MTIKKIKYTALFLLFFLNAIAQTTSINYANDKYEKYAYVDAIKVYESVANKGYKDEKMFQRLGNSYYFNGELVKALKWYDELFAMNEQQEPEYLYRYAQCLKSAGNYAKADTILEKFNEKVRTDKRGVLFESNKNYLEEIKTNSGRFEIADAGINSNYSDYGSAIFNDKLVFTSARDTGGIAKKNFKWTNKSFTNLYAAELKSDGSIGVPQRFQKKVNTKFNESTPVFTKDGRTMYFTRNNFLNGKRGRDENKITLLKLYKADLVDGVWKNILELPFNSDQYSVAHPTLSVDEKTLYFASDMPGTLGQSDLFKVSINDNGTFGTPQNLGAKINTEGRETFPFISSDNELYFATDGRPGLGGLDVFVAKINDNGTFDDIQNVGEPINSKQDDFAFIINSKNRNGFFSSNRDNGHGFDDIYRFTEKRKLTCEQELAGTITDLDTKAIIANATVALFDETFQPVTQVVSDEKGNYIFRNVNCGKNYFVRVAKVDYESKEVPVTIKKISGKTALSVQLEKRVKAIEVGTDLAKTLDIPIIYFDLDKATIKKESAYQLEKIIEILKQYPTLTLDIRSHTDSRQTAKYNQVLSDKRAKSTMNWLVQKGIDSNRLTAKGYGESQLVNQCSDGVNCTEEEHQLNRRSEFVITHL
ncbi:OmpA family protein [Flavobacterium hibernum]|uniref:Flagellar motor protein MotB n=1 Tax=Flavobacterium hibernum TaxID=37752 RepID=A0A0D0F0L3_9FLAO|nr:OmpA family protein [Flavobacterium hibernum]KIO53106.1 flagellar motor protein MotB [Flavobacterium hibernum]OXA85863.1 flagellar motor protein MotB [Flavobacterium hibernum]STO15128.1 Outer membrane porin F precursor [Flavobacterium hibernum]